MKQVIDLSAIKPPDFLSEISVEGAVAEMKADLLARMAAEGIDLSDSLRESDPAMKIMQAQAGREGFLGARINAGFLATRVAFAEDADLDTLLAFADLERQVIDPGDASANPPIPATMESNDRARRRFVLHWNTLSNGAPEGFYESFVLNNVKNVFDVYSVSPSPCEITLFILPRPGAATAATLAAVHALFADDKKPPQGDRVTVQPASLRPYRVVADLGVAGGPDSGIVGQAALAAITAYVAWSETYGKTPLGRGIEIPFLHAALAVAGVTTITLTEPVAAVACGPNEAAQCVEIVLSVNGVAV